MGERRRYVCGHRLPALEADVFELLLDSGRPLSVAEVRDALPGPARAHTTVSTLLTRLAERGLVRREKRDGHYEWSPADTPEGLAVSALKEVLSGVEDPDAVVLGFLQSLKRSSRRRGEGGNH